MLRKCLCCGSKSRQEQEFNAGNPGELNEFELQMKEESVKRNTKILREDLYQNYMRPYFKLG